MRSRLSRTVESGRPTVVKHGSPEATSTSTDTVAASMPWSVAERTLASMGESLRTPAPAVNASRPIQGARGVAE